MKKVSNEIIPMLNEGAMKQVVKPNMAANEKVLCGLIHETFNLYGTVGLEKLERTFKGIAEQLKEQDILKLENDGTATCYIWENKLCRNDYYWYCVENGLKHDIPCYLCGYYSEEQIEEIRFWNRVKMILEGTWTYYPIRMERVGACIDE